MTHPTIGSKAVICCHLLSFDSAGFKGHPTNGSKAVVCCELLQGSNDTQQMVLKLSFACVIAGFQ